MTEHNFNEQLKLTHLQFLNYKKNRILVSRPHKLLGSGRDRHEVAVSQIQMTRACMTCSNATVTYTASHCCWNKLVVFIIASVSLVDTTFRNNNSMCILESLSNNKKTSFLNELLFYFLFFQVQVRFEAP